MNKIKSFLKNRDTLGHQVNLTIANGNGNEQTSTFGGVITIFIYCFISAYFVIKSFKMYESNLDNISSNEEVIDFDEVNHVNLTGMMPVINI